MREDFKELFIVKNSVAMMPVIISSNACGNVRTAAEDSVVKRRIQAQKQLWECAKIAIEGDAI